MRVESKSDAVRVALIFLALAMACGGLLFGKINGPRSVVLDGAFIVCALTFVGAMVVLFARHANWELRGPGSSPLHLETEECDRLKRSEHPRRFADDDVPA